MGPKKGNKENIYPIVNIDMTETDVSENQVIVVSFLITVLQQRDVRPVKTNSKLLEDTNYIDNLNETHSICMKFINNLYQQNNSANIEVNSISTLKPLKNFGSQMLDGFDFTINLSIPNMGNSCI